MELLKNIRERKNLIKIGKDIDNGIGPLVEFDRLGAIFVHIPKCAGVSVNKTIFGNLGGAHKTLKDYRVIFGKKKFDSFFKFTIVRNPWDRLVSAFHFLKKGGMNWADNEWAMKNISEFKDFNTFVKSWLNEDNIWKYHHFRPQYHYITLNGKNIAVDYVGHLESINTDFKIITQKIGIDAELGKENTSRREDYQKYYNTETVKIVSEVYKKDIELLGYDYESNNSIINDLNLKTE